MEETQLAVHGKTWRLLVGEPAGGAYNMAVDEAIMLSHAEGEGPPTLRLYSWSPPTVSVGLFQDINRKVDLDRCRELGIDVVRRPTGGRAVLHDKEITYSVVIKRDLLPGSVLQTYKFLSKGLLEAIKVLGLTPAIAEKPAKPSLSGSPACFDSPSWYEIEVSGRKLVGSAQTRQRDVLLQHGSILLELEPDKLQQVMRFPNTKIRDRLTASLKANATAINPELKRIGRPKVEPSSVVAALIEGFRSGLEITLEQDILTDNERRTAKELAEGKYSSESWTLFRKGCG